MEGYRSIMLKNTEGQYEIVEKRETLKKSFRAGVIVFALMSALIASVLSYSSKRNKYQTQNTQTVMEAYDNSGKLIREGGYGNYFSEYRKALENHSNQTFDDAFKTICSNKNCIINGKEYMLSELYVIKCDNGKVYLVKAGENNLDIISNEQFNYKEKIIMKLTETLPFYEMYSEGIFNENSSLSIDPKMFTKYFINWNGETHLKTLDQVAYNEAVNNYVKKYGG